jgi:hypothetical protein
MSPFAQNYAKVTLQAKTFPTSPNLWGLAAWNVEICGDNENEIPIKWKIYIYGLIPGQKHKRTYEKKLKSRILCYLLSNSGSCNDSKFRSAYWKIVIISWNMTNALFDFLHRAKIKFYNKVAMLDFRMLENGYKYEVEEQASRCLVF